METTVDRSPRMESSSAVLEVNASRSRAKQIPDLFEALITTMEAICAIDSPSLDDHHCDFEEGEKSAIQFNKESLVKLLPEITSCLRSTQQFIEGETDIAFLRSKVRSICFRLRIILENQVTTVHDFLHSDFYELQLEGFISRLSAVINE